MVEVPVEDGTVRGVPVDRCMAPMVRGLLAEEVITTESCCGHGEMFGVIGLEGDRCLVLLESEDEWYAVRNALWRVRGIGEDDDTGPTRAATESESDRPVPQPVLKGD